MTDGWRSTILWPEETWLQKLAISKGWSSKICSFQKQIIAYPFLGIPVSMPMVRVSGVVDEKVSVPFQKAIAWKHAMSGKPVPCGISLGGSRATGKLCNKRSMQISLELLHACGMNGTRLESFFFWKKCPQWYFIKWFLATIMDII